MFTGLVAAIGTVTAVRRTTKGLAITIAVPWRDLKVGESVAVDGACLTVARTRPGTFTVEAVATTRGRTIVEDYRRGRRVNLERALRMGDRLGGHLVSGHVDGVGTVTVVRSDGDALLLDLKVPAAIAELTVLHGSIAVDGVSLTVNAIPKPGVVQVSLIPVTRRATTLGSAVVGRKVHLEADQIAKLVRHMMTPHRAGRRRKP